MPPVEFNYSDRGRDMFSVMLVNRYRFGLHASSDIHGIRISLWNKLTILKNQFSVNENNKIKLVVLFTIFFYQR